ncbi:hypothetical protein [Rhizobium leguminosarum]|uniref:hypothetical protein n=1 Tax=Rhizobium leguminosarum TaxID=384 RepID=UPI001C9257D6|nr:hypothetical protein [Rhizobium leguminosarum]MBY2918854.1 hypothetical protein [Rhizobium leguminosarum]MBY2974551.1 hypothetical protein [Rhizobium leguminosarum]MBY2981984.1 hypothetical protein [Rhizobium leguminosarum]MBY3010500.1 hypothetical protein [Rhizobium leguminosarum]
MNSIDFTNVSEFIFPAFNLVGSGPLYVGYGAAGNPVDGPTYGIKVKQSETFSLVDPIIKRVANGIDISQTPSWQDGGSVRGGRVSHCFRGVWIHDVGEGVFVSDINVSDCVFGVVVDAGNSNIANGQSTRCSVGLLIDGGADNVNNAHGSVVGWNSRHNSYNLSCQNVTLGHSLTGCNFIGGQAGADQGGIQIYNSKGIMINGGQIAYANITVDATSQLALRDVTFRGPVKITVTPGGYFDAKGCWAMPGATMTISLDGGLNYTTFSGNTP